MFRKLFSKIAMKNYIFSTTVLLFEDIIYKFKSYINNNINNDI